jgi:predicted transcriptional regulator
VVQCDTKMWPWTSSRDFRWAQRRSDSPTPRDTGNKTVFRRILEPERAQPMVTTLLTHTPIFMAGCGLRRKGYLSIIERVQTGFQAMNEHEVRPHDHLVALTAGVVAAYVQNHVVAPGSLGELISSVHLALGNASPVKFTKVSPADEKQKPAVSIRKSVTDEFLICLEDGKKYRSLKRHLNARYGLSPDEYRAKWGLPENYPMVAPGYAAKRSELARRHGLGQIRKTL